jgi:putative transcription factor
MMNVCGNCVKFGVEQAGGEAEVTGRSRTTAALENRAVRSRQRDVFSDMPEELVEDYGERVRQARQKHGLSIEDLGKKLNERQTELAKLEQGTYHPPDTLVRKLEKFFNIKLMEKPEFVPGSAKPAGAGGPVTLGDLIRDAQKKPK